MAVLSARVRNRRAALFNPRDIDQRLI